MNVVSKLSVTEDVTLVTFNRVSADFRQVAAIFERFSMDKIDIDMISQSAPQSDSVSVSFTMNDSDVGKVFSAARQIAQHFGVKPLVSTGYCKVQLYGENMRGTSGVASRAFSAVAAQGCQVMMVTTSEVDISLLVSQEHLADTIQALEQEFTVALEG